MVPFERCRPYSAHMDNSAKSTAPTIGDDASAEVAERARHQLRVHAVGLSLLGAGEAFLWLRPEGWSAEYSMAVAGASLTVGAMLWSSFGNGGRRAAASLLSEYAVMNYIDPGPGRREDADDKAAEMVHGQRRGVLLFLALLVPQLFFVPRDDVASTLLGAALLALSGAVFLLDHRRAAACGRRWRANPPGPSRT